MAETIYLEPDCGAGDRCWSLNPDGDCDCGAPWVRYIRADIHDAEIARLKAQVENMIGALTVIRKSAEQSGNWPPHRVYASTEGIEKVAIRALADYRGK